MKKTATFYFSNGTRSAAMATDRDRALLDQVEASLQGSTPVLRIPLMKEEGKGDVLVVRRQDLLAVSVGEGKKAKKKKKTKQAPPDAPEIPASV